MGQSITETGAFAIQVSGNTVSITDSGVTGTGTLSVGNSFTVTLPAISVSQDGVTCSVVPTYTGTISGNNVSGSISGPFTCNGVAGTTSGSFTAVRGNGKQLNKSLKDIVRKAVSEVN